jgi:hypothetical protein
MCEAFSAFNPRLPGCRNWRRATGTHFDNLVASVESCRSGRAGENQKRLAIGVRPECERRRVTYVILRDVADIGAINPGPRWPACAKDLELVLRIDAAKKFLNLIGVLTAKIPFRQLPLPMLYFGAQPMLSGIRNAGNALPARASRLTNWTALCSIIESPTGAHRSWFTFQIWSEVHFRFQ